MACPFPQTITRAPWEGIPSDHPGIHTHRRSGETRVTMSVPCGSCPDCLAARAMQWAIRCHHEGVSTKRKCMVTLTYDDEHLPDRLDPKHLTDFLKRLRFSIRPAKIRYYACGEYGDHTRRPHYHLLVFGADFLHDSEVVHSNGDYTSRSLLKAWGKGYVQVSPFKMNTCLYVAGYVAKKIGDADCFQRMSRTPPIGQGWFQKYEDDIRRNGVVVIEGTEYPVPKRYFDWTDMQDIKDWRRDVAKKKQEAKTTEHKIAAARSKRIRSLKRLQDHKKGTI